jgi:FkbM family methyltransferase
VLESKGANNKINRRLQKLYKIRQKLHPPGDSQLKIAQLDNGIKIRVNLCELVGANLYYGIQFEQKESLIISKLVKSGETFFDIGANIGIHCLKASILVGKTGAVHAFEPLNHVYKELIFNLELNKIENVIANNVAVLNESREVSLYINRESALSSLGDTKRGKFTNIEKVFSITLDEYAKKSLIERIDFLKIDVEGFEGHVLRGAKDLILNSSNLVILCELAEKNYKPLGFSINEVVDWIRDQGFEVWEIDSGNHSIINLENNKDPYINQNFIFIRPNSKKYELIIDMHKNDTII